MKDVTEFTKTEQAMIEEKVMSNDTRMFITLHSCKISMIFRMFADILDDDERLSIAREEDRDLRELLEIISDLKRYAWENMGGVAIPNIDDSVPLEH